MLNVKCNAAWPETTQASLLSVFWKELLERLSPNLNDTLRNRGVFTEIEDEGMTSQKLDESFILNLLLSGQVNLITKLLYY